MPAIEARDLVKVFRTPVKESGIAASLRQFFKPNTKEFRAVDGVSFTIEEGQIVGFLGPNGAGKTTTIKMLTGIIAPTSGQISVQGYLPFQRNHAMLRQIALVAGNRQQLWWDLPAADSFEVLTEIYNLDRAYAKARVKRLVDELCLGEKVGVQVRKLSLGERMKCELVAALLHSPRVIFLDEPTIGLDIMSQKRIREFLREFNREEGTTILLTSHYMQDVEELCERVILIDKGRVGFDGTLDVLKTRFTNGRRLTFGLSTHVDPKAFEVFGKVVESTDDSITLDVASEDVARVCSTILTNYKVIDLQVAEPAIEDVIASALVAAE